MPPPLLFPLERFDLARIAVPIEEVRKVNPQRFEMEQLDGIVGIDLEEGIVLGVKQVRRDEFWARGHIPGRPLMPAVVMLEAAGQTASYFVKLKLGLGERFMGFAGIDRARFRGSVAPGDTLYILSRSIDVRVRKSLSHCQGVVSGRLVFECDIMGMIF